MRRMCWLDEMPVTAQGYDKCLETRKGNDDHVACDASHKYAMRGMTASMA